MTNIASKDVQNLPVSDHKGVVFATKGKIVDQNGNVISVGESVTKGEVLQTGPDSAVLVKFAGGVLVLGHEQQIDIDQRLLDLINKNKVEDAVDEGVDFDRLEQALEEGLNLEELLPATAAGSAPTSSGAGSAAGAGVRFVLTGAETIPLAGFETTAPDIAFNGPNDQSDAFDSEPEATDDEDSVTSLGVATGNVVTGIDVTNGDSNTQDGNADDSGLNGFGTSIVVGVALGSEAVVSDGSNVGQAFSSDKGTLILNADGSYQYTPFREATGQDVFSYTVSDVDGDLSTATLTINIDAIPSLEITPPGPDGSGTDQNTVSEAGLPEGTQAGNGSNTTEGQIRYFAGDGAATVQIGGVNVIVNGELQVSEVQGQFGRLIITSVDASGINYRYELDQAADHSQGAVQDDFTVVISDNDGNAADDISSTLSIAILDDGPIAQDQNDAIDTSLQATGNVITGQDVAGGDANTSDGVADQLGADGAGSAVVVGVVSGNSSDESNTGVGQTITSDKGTLVLNADGSYQYTANPGAFGEDTFTYTMQDADGSTDVAILTINVDAANILADDDETATLLSGETASGNVLANTDNPDGPEAAVVTSFIFNGTEYQAGESVTAAGLGTFTITADGSYNFGASSGFSGTVPPVQYTVSDGINEVTSTLNITVIAPNILSDGNEVVTVPEDTVGTGNVLANVVNPDGPSESLVTFTVDGSTYTPGQTATIAGVGTLLIDTDGTYTFTPELNYNGPVPVTTYTVTDGVDTVSSTLSISVGAVNDLSDDDETFSTPEDTPLSDNVLNNSTNPDGPGPAEVTTFTVGGSNYVAGDTATIVDGGVTVGQLTLNSDGSFTFNPANNYAGPVPAINYTVSDGASSVNSTLNLSVGAVNDLTDGDESISTNEDTPTNGNVLDNTNNPDGPSPASVTGFSIGGTNYSPGTTVPVTQAGVAIGDFTLNSDGSYTFSPAPNYNGAGPTVDYQVTDGAATVNSQLQITVNPVDDGDPSVTIPDNNGGATGDESVQEDATVTGNTFTISAPDGLVTFTIAGQAITAAALANASTTNITVVGSEGTLIITNYDPSSGVVTYNYDPTGTAKDHSGGEITDAFAVTVEDSAGSTASGVLDILITDTAPVANADTDATNADTNTSGNVRTDVGGADVDGADAAEISGVAAGTQTGDISGGVNTAIAGTLGSLTIQADGSYTYTPGAGAAALAEGATATDTFSYTLKDNDGSFSTTTVTITVTGTTDGAPTVTITDNNAGATGDESVQEDATLTGNTFTVSAPDGLGSISVAGQNITAAALNNASTTNIAVNTSQGVLTITDYNSATGVVTYNYDPAGTAKDHTSGEVVDNIAVVVTDSDGTTANGTLDILITDTAPVANADTDSTDADTNTTGNVRTDAGGADVDGADAAEITGVVAGTQTGDISGGVNTAIAGTLGSLTIQADGSYTYTPGAGAAALAEGATATDTFSYTLKDDDGSFSTTTVTITVTGTTDGAPTVTITDNNAGATGDESVQEDATLTGNTFTISASDGLGSISVAGQNITAAALNNASTTNIAVNTSQGLLTITDYNSTTGVVTYNYDPAGTAKDHTSGEVVDNIAVVVTDSDGTTANGTLDILITDTAPVANADTDSTDADSNTSGNVRTDVGGADVDGADAAEITGVVAGTQTGDIVGGVNTAIAGTLGSLTIQADGSYTYTPGAGAAALAEGATATDTFSYTLKDDDGSFSTTTVTITVTGTTDGAPTVTITDNNAGATGDESVQEDATLTGNAFTINTPDGLGSLSIAGQSITAAALNNASTTNITVSTTDGVLTITDYNSATGVVTYNYDPAGTSQDHNGAEVVHNFAIVVTDSDGTTASDSLDILITDTAPVANADTDATNADTNATGNVRTDVGGADVDGADAAEISGVAAGTQTGDISGGVNTAIAGTLGSLTIQADGSYTYTPGAGAAALAEGATATDTFSYTLKDNDGSFSTTTVTITVTGTTDGAPTVTITDNNAGATGDESVQEDAALTGNTFTISAPDGLGSISVAGQTITAAALNNASTTNIAVNTSQGLLTITDYNSATGVVTYNYDPAGTAKDHTSGEVVDNIAVVVTDSDGTTANGTLDILITDTAPVANADTDSTDADTNTTGNVRTDAGGADVDGADAAEITGVVAGTQTGDISGGVNTAIAGTLGSLTIQADGSYTYTPGAGAAALAEGATATDTFSYTLKDDDGSFSTTTVTITVTGTTDGLPTVTITDNNAGATGDESVQEDATLTGNTFTINTPDGLGSLSIAGQTITAVALNNASTTNIAVNTAQGLLTITDYNSATGVVTYNYDPAGTSQDHSGAEVVHNFAIVVTDSDGTTASDSLDILITDTAPVANADTDSTDADNNATGNVRTDVGGADVDGADAAEITGVVAGMQTGDISGGVNTAIAGTLGSLTIQADGSYTYTPGAGAAALAEGATATDTFSYTLKDNDGSFSTTTVTITVTGTTDGAPTVTITDNNAGATGDESVQEDATLTGNTFTITAPDGLGSISVAGQNITAAALNNASTTNIAVNTSQGLLTITDYNSATGVVTYNYDPAGTAKDHTSGEVVDNIAVVVTDSDGTTANGTL
ncbi:Ig-like domain-containing protein, partial [Pseudoteredinibacter isoporae]|nr:VCBS repeat-containing protein [Pseudoteredinibacter isoporae]